MFLLSPLFLGPFGQFSIRSQVWETKWSRDASHHKSPSPMMIITPSHSHSHSQASDPLGQSEDKLEADQWEAHVGLECSHCSQSPTLVVIIAGLTLTHSSLSDQLSPVLGVCCFKALCAHWSLVSIMRTITYRQQTPEQPPPPLTCLQCPQHQVVDTRHPKLLTIGPYTI